MNSYISPGRTETSGRVFACGLLAALFTATIPSEADDWPHWRGPNRNGISSEAHWKDTWSADEPTVLWKARVGTGFSSVTVASERAYTMGNEDNQDTVWCFDANTGALVWKHSYPADLGDKYFEGGTTGTPTVAGNQVFTLSRWGDLHCFDAESGRILWSKNVQMETGARIPSWGFGGSPLVHDDLVILNVGDAGMALDRNSGKTLWHSATKEAGYSTPFPLKVGSNWHVVLGSGQSYVAVNLHTGVELWRHRWLTQYGVNAADPIISGDRMFVSTGYGKGGVMLTLGTSIPDEVWKTKNLRTQMNPAVLIDGHLYGTDGDAGSNATLKCIEFATGTEKWSHPGTGFGGIIAANGRLILLSERGELLVAPASPDGFNPTARAQVLGGRSWTAPVLANGRIYCRNSRGDVVCVDVRQK